MLLPGLKCKRFPAEFGQFPALETLMLRFNNFNEDTFDNVADVSIPTCAAVCCYGLGLPQKAAEDVGLLQSSILSSSVGRIAAAMQCPAVVVQLCALPYIQRPASLRLLLPAAVAAARVNLRVTESNSTARQPS
jgi:hypothetical protein